MKSYLKFLLARNPALYSRIIRLKKRIEYDNERIVFLNAVRNGDVVCDIGANRGNYTIFLSHIVGRSGEVHGFEPVPPTFEKLSGRVNREKHFDNIHLNNMACGDKPGRATINLPGTDDGQASIARHSSGSWKGERNVSTFDCEVTTLDAYVSEKMRRPPVFLKCDVEGAEMLAMRGAQQTLSKHQPILFLEVCKDWTADFGYAPLDLFVFVKSFGYDTFYLIDDRIRKLDDPEAELAGDRLKASADLLCGVEAKHAGRMCNLF